jgi:hypothetical protein
MKSKNKIFKVFFIFLIVFSIFLVCLITLPFVICGLGLESRPLVVHEKQLTFEDVKRIRDLLRENNPRRLQPVEVKSVWITELCT